MFWQSLINGMFLSRGHHRNVALGKTQIPVSSWWELRRCSYLSRLVESSNCFFLMKMFKQFLMKALLYLEKGVPCDYSQVGNVL